MDVVAPAGRQRRTEPRDPSSPCAKHFVAATTNRIQL